MKTTGKILTGFLIGAVTGGVTALLMAPSSGRKTRKRIQKESKRMTDQFVQQMNKSLDLAKETYNQKLGEYAKKGKVSIDHLKDHVSA